MDKRSAPFTVVTIGLALILITIRSQHTGPSTAVSGVTRALLPLSFEPNQGQADPRVKFISRSNGGTIFLTPNEAVLALTRVSFPVAKNLSQGGGAEAAPPP